MRVGEVWGLIRAFYGRYFRLGLLVFGPSFVLVMVGTSIQFWLWHTRCFTRRLECPDAFNQGPLIRFLLFIPFDMLLTFVTPALAYTTPSVRRALTVGCRTLRDEWPRSAGYVIVPPLAAIVGVESLPPEAVGQVGKIALSVIAVLFNLWFKGATAAFYLRRHDTGDDGAAFQAQDSAPAVTTFWDPLPILARIGFILVGIGLIRAGIGFPLLGFHFLQVVPYFWSLFGGVGMILIGLASLAISLLRR